MKSSILSYTKFQFREGQTDKKSAKFPFFSKFLLFEAHFDPKNGMDTHFLFWRVHLPAVLPIVFSVVKFPFPSRFLFLHGVPCAEMKPFRIFLIYDSVRLARNRWFAETLTEKCARRGWKLEMKLLEEFQEWSPETVGQDRPDAVFMRCTSPEFSRRYEEAGVRVFNSACVSEITNDKLKTFRHFSPLGIPMMASRELDPASLPPFPFVLKSRDGHGGSEVFCVHDAVELQHILERETEGRPFFSSSSSSSSFSGYFGYFGPFGRWMVQSLADTPGRDLRIYVVGNEIIAAMERRSESDFRSNYSLGGSAFRRELTDGELELAGRILKLMKFDFAGIDLIFHEGLPVLNEIEDVVGSRMLYAHTDLDILELFLDHAERELNV